MELNFIDINNVKIAEVISEKTVINNVQDALDLIGNCDYNYAKKIILNKEHIHENFYDLKTKLAGDILQKFTNYQMELAIIGDFSNYKSKSLQDFICECNKNKKFCFLKSRQKAFDIFAGN